MRRIAICNECSEGAAAAASFVLDDFQDAYAAYERHSLNTLGPLEADESPGASFEFCTPFEGAGDVGNATAYDSADNAAPIDVALIAFDDISSACSRALSFEEGICIYGIRFNESVFPSQATRELEMTCRQHNLKWMGALLVSRDAQSVARLKDKTRMGWRRRKLSEATDRLIACVRSGISVHEAAEVFGATKKQRVQAQRNLIIF